MLKHIISTIILTLTTFTAHATENKRCLATAIYMEGRGESVVAQAAIRDVILNRARASNTSVCNVIRQKGQFSWCLTKYPMKPYNAEMKAMLKKAEGVGRVLISENYLYFFRKELKPKWARKLKCVVLEGHKYCRVKEE